MNTLVAVHGGWFGGWCWEEVSQLLEEQGYRTSVVEQLGSVGSDPSTLGDLSSDAAQLRRHVDALGGPVTLVGHSYGGMVITELADHPAVRHSVYLSAFWPEAGETVLDLAGEELPGWMAARPDGCVQVSPDVEAVKQAFFAGLDDEEAKEVHRKLQLTSLAAFQTPSTGPERRHPTTFVVCERDQAIPPFAQEAMATKADEIVRIPAAHCAMMAAPGELAPILARTLNGAR